MRAVADCIPCMIDDLAGASRLILDAKDAEAVVREGLSYLGERFTITEPPPRFITELHRLLKRRVGEDVLFADRRRSCSRIGQVVAECLGAKVSGKDDRDTFMHLLRWALAANFLDFRTAGIGYEYDLSLVKRRLDEDRRRLPVRDDSEVLWERVTAASDILYIPDNVGELSLDRLLIALLTRMDKRVTVAMRGGAITSDATMEEAEEIGFASVADRLILAGPDTLGISLREMTVELKEALQGSDLVISKGQANYCVLSEIAAHIPGTVSCLFTIKCMVVASELGISQQGSVVAVLS